MVAPRAPRALPCDQLHLFSTEVARTHGLGAATVYGYLAWHCRNHGKWTGTKPKLLETHPYISPKELRLALARLLGKAEGYPKLLSRIQDGIHFIYALTQRVRGGKFYAFDPKMAAAYGILPAAIYDNLVYWIAEDDANGALEPTHYLGPAEALTLHSYAPLRSIERAFKTLREAGEIMVIGRHEGRIPKWTIPLGEGKLDRWQELHRRSKIEPVNKDDRPHYAPSFILEDV